MVRVAVAQLDCRRPREQLRVRLHAVLEACRAWSVKLLVVPDRPIVAELLEGLEMPTNLVVIADGRSAGERLVEPHAVMTVDEFVFRSPGSDRARTIAARRAASFVILTGRCSGRDRRHLVRYRRPVVVVNDAQIGGTDIVCGEVSHAIDRESEGLLVADLGADMTVFACAAMIEPDTRDRQEYLGWGRQLLAEIDAGQSDLEGVRARVDAATGLLTDRRLFDRWRANFVRELLIRLDVLPDVASAAAYLRELTIPASVSRAEPQVGPGLSAEQLGVVERIFAGSASTDLRGVDFERASLVGVDLRDTQLDEATLRGCDLSQADLRGASLRSADLSGARLWHTRLDRADLREATLNGVDAHASRLADAQLSVADVSGSHWTACDWTGVRGQPIASTPWIREPTPATTRAAPQLRNLGPASSQRLAWSPDASLLAVGGWTHVAIWRVAERRMIALLDRKLHADALAWSPDGRELAVGPTLGAVQIWSLAQLRVRLELPQQRAGLQSLAWSPDGGALAGNTGTVWSTGDGTPEWTFTEPVDRVRFAPDGRLLGRRRTELVVLERTGATSVRHPAMPGPMPLALEWLADGERFISVDRAGTVRFHASSGEVSRSVALGRRFDAVAVSLDDTMLAASWEGHTLTYSLVDGRLLSSDAQPSAWLRVLEWSARGDLGSLARPGGALIRPARDRSPIMLSSASELRSLCHSPDGTKLATLSEDGVRIWSPEWTPLSRPFGSGTRVVWSPDGRLLGLAARNGNIEIWTAAGAVIARLDEPRTCRSIAWSADGAQLIAIDGLGNLWRWTSRGRPLAELEPLGFGDHTLSPSADRIARSNLDHVEIRPTTAGAGPTVRVPTPAPHYHSFLLRWSLDGAWLCNPCNHGVQLIRAADGHVLFTNMRAAIGHDRIGWSPCGTMVAIVVEGGVQVQVLELGDELRVRTSFGCRRASSLAWSRSGEALLVGGENGVLEVRRSDDGRLLGTIEFAGETALLRTVAGAFAVVGDPREVGLAIEVERSRWLVPLAGSIHQQDLANVLAELSPT